MKKYNHLIDVIIPAYNVPDEILFRCLSSIACQDIAPELTITIVDDASVKQNYLEVIKHFEPFLKINLLRYEENKGPGVARQYGLDHTSNGYVTFIDADDTFNGSFALKSLRNGLNAQTADGSQCQMSVGLFEEIHEEGLAPNEGPMAILHEQDLVWMFGKMYRRSFLDKYNIKFHPTSRANEDSGFNTLCRLCLTEKESINFLPIHVYYWHEKLDSITRINNCQYSYGSSEKDSFYGYVENMIYALQNAQKKAPYNIENINLQILLCMINIYIYYIECCAKAPEHSEANFNWCKRYYNELYSKVSQNFSDEIIGEYFSITMKDMYAGDRLNGFVPCMSFFEFLNKLKQ